MREKISFGIKQKAVTEIESGRLSQSEAARRLGINEKTIRRWMSKYRSEGSAGLASSNKNRIYSTQTKQQAVEACLTGQYSQQRICESGCCYTDGKVPDGICCIKICQEQNTLGSKNLILFHCPLDGMQFKISLSGGFLCLWRNAQKMAVCLLGHAAIFADTVIGAGRVCGAAAFRRQRIRLPRCRCPAPHRPARHWGSGRTGTGGKRR